MKRLLCLILALLTVLPAAVSCGTTADAPAAGTTAAAENASADAGSAAQTAAETRREDTADSLPELDFDGKTVAILYRDVPNLPPYEMIADLTGDIVDDAVYNRNLKVCERLNIVTEYSGQGTAAASDVPTPALNAVLAGEDLYQIWVWQQAKCLKLVTEGIFTDMAGDPYIDLSQPWWNKGYMAEINIGSDRTYFYAGDIILSIIACLSMNMVNRTLYESLYGDPDDLYGEVLDGGFTYDRYNKLIEGCYSDINGDGVADDGDRYGATVTPVSTTELLAYSSGMVLTRRDADDLPYLDVVNEKNAAILEAANDLYYNNPGTLIVAETEIIDEKMENRFAAGQMLFLPKWFASTDLLRSMDTDYGIVPFPKLDETQDEYHALVHNIASTVCVPITAAEPAVCGAFMEAMAAESYRTVIPAYYEVGLKVKYSRDNLSSQMIDLIYDAACTNFAYAFSALLGSVGTLARTVVGKQTEFVSYYASIETAAQTGLDELLAQYSK